jgi:hypothetical protein
LARYSAFTCDPSYSRGRNWEDDDSREKLDMVSSSYTGRGNMRLEVQAGPAKMQDPILGREAKQKGLGGGSSGKAPALRSNPITTKKRKKERKKSDPLLGYFDMF